TYAPQRYSLRRTNHVNCDHYPAQLHASRAAAEAGMPVIVQTAHTLVVRPGDVLLGRLSHAHTIATSAAVSDLLLSAGLPADRIDIIHNGIGPEHFGVDPELVHQTRASLRLEG